MSARLAMLSTYPPRRCGIATFARDLRTAVGGGVVAAVRRPEDATDYPDEVRWWVDRDDRTCYREVAARLRSAGVDVVSVQHEYGIFGGDDGAWVLDFLDALGVPAVATLHTILPRPTPGQRAVLGRVVERAAASVVMSEAAARLLESQYDAVPARVHVIPHGVPDLPLVDPSAHKPGLGLDGRTVVLSFGLLGPGKGLEHMVEAVAWLRRTSPDILFVIVGATHPDLLRVEGERYRESLQARVQALGLGSHVRFVNRYLDMPELVRFLLAADVYVTAYPNLDQIASGTLAYALGAGKPIVSTPYAHARELLADGRGILVEPASATALASALEPLIQDAGRRRTLGLRAWLHARSMVWNEVGGAYRAVFAAAAAGAPDTGGLASGGPPQRPERPRAGSAVAVHG